MVVVPPKIVKKATEMVPFPINKLGFINPGLTLPLLIVCFVEGGILLGLELMNIGGQYNP